MSTGVVHRARQQFAVGHRVTCQPVCHDRSRLATETREQVPEEAPGGRCVPSLLKQHVDDFTVLVDGPPELPVLTPDPDEDLVHEDGVSVASVTTPQPLGVTGSKLVAPEADRLVGDGNAAPPLNRAPGLKPGPPGTSPVPAHVLCGQPHPCDPALAELISRRTTHRRGCRLYDCRTRAVTGWSGSRCR